MELRRDHLVMLLNGLSRQGVDTVTVDHPAEDVGTLLRIRLRDEPTATVQFRTRLADYRAARDDVRLQYGDRPFDDLPDPGAYVAALTGSGLLDFANRDRIDDYLDDVCYPAVESGDPPVMVGIDANVFPWDIPSRLGIDHRTGDTDDRDRRPTNGYALSNGVVDELHWKFSHYEVDSLVDAFGEEFRRLEGQPGGSKREGRLGIQAYQSLVGSANVDIVDSEPGDDEIIDGYVRYDERSRKRPLLLSNDYEFVEKALDRGLFAQHVAFRSSLPRRTTVPWSAVVDALYYLTLAFGVLVLPKATLYGVWTEKTDRNWQREELDVDCRGAESALRPHLVRHRRIASEFDRIW